MTLMTLIPCLLLESRREYQNQSNLVKISGDMSEQIYAHYRPDIRRYLGADLHTLSARFKEIFTYY